MQLQAPLLDAPQVHVNQRLMNMTRVMKAAELARVRAGYGRPEFGERQGMPTYADRDERGERRTCDVLAVEDYDAAFAALLDAHKHPGLRRFHTLVQRKYAGIGRRKSARWYQNSATNQLHSRMHYRNARGHLRAAPRPPPDRPVQLLEQAVWCVQVDLQLY